MKKIVILLSGEGLNAENIVKKLHKKSCDVVAAISNKPEAGGLKRLEALGVETRVLEHKGFESREAFDTELVKLINEYTPDLVVLSGFMRILTPVFTEQVNSINIHPSMLPKFKGAKAIEQSFADENETEGGVSVHHVTTELDSGEIILQKGFMKSEGETLESFTTKIKEIEYEIFPLAIEKVLSK